MLEESSMPPDGEPGEESWLPPPDPQDARSSGATEVSHENEESELDPLAELEAAQAALQRAEAVRIVALLKGYRDAMDEVVAVFGPSSDDRGDPFARSY